MGLIPERVGVSVEDDAQHTADLFLTGAIAQQQQRAQRAPAAVPGVCTNCGAACLPAAVYCEAACRDDHEARLRSRRRLSTR